MSNFYPSVKGNTTFNVSPNCPNKQLLNIFFTGLILTCSLIAGAQGISINPRMNFILNGNITMVVNNAPLRNNGNFIASTSTVKFSGSTDTTLSYVDGCNSTTFHNLSVNKSAYGIALKSKVGVRNVLAVTEGNLYTDSNLTLKSDANLTARLDVVPSSCQIIGKAHVERYFPARRAWRLVTAPVTNTNTIYNTWQNRGVYTPGLGTLVTGSNPTGANGNGLDVSYQNNISMKGWNAITKTFSNVINTHTALSPGKSGRADNIGYFLFVRGDRNPRNTNIPNSNITTLTSIGTLQTGTQTFYASTASGAYTLIGNPYASPIDFDKVSRTNLVKRFYAWDPTINELGGYVMMDDLNNDGVYVTSILASKQTKEIQSSQSVLVETRNNGEANITFNESSKSCNNNNLVFRPETPNSPTELGVGEMRILLNLVEPDNSTKLGDGVLAEFDNIYSASVDRDDALKLGNVDENLAIQRGSSSLAAERRPALTINDTLFLKLTKLVQRNYQFEFKAVGLEQPNMAGFLMDSYLKTNTPVNLSGGTTVNFSVNAQAGSSAANRFMVVFKMVSTLPVTLTNVTAYQKANGISVDWKVENEINMQRYEVEKSSNGSTFALVNTTPVTGSNNLFNNYNWFDANPVNGINYYRIKTYDKSGAIHYSIIVKVSISNTVGGFGIYPNPVTGKDINLQINNQAAGNYNLRLTNGIGQLIKTFRVSYSGGNSTQTINTDNKLAAGIYQLEIIGQDKLSHIQQVIVE